MLSLRHYSNLRFIMLPVFFTATAGLVSAAYGNKIEPQALPPVHIEWAGTLLTVIFFWLEVTLDRYMVRIGEIATELKPHSHWSRLPACPRRLVRIPLWGQYLLVLTFWSSALYSHYLEADPPAVNNSADTPVRITIRLFPAQYPPCASPIDGVGMP